MSKIGIYGGSFDPIGNHHVAIGLAAQDHPDLDAVWFMPCYQHRFDKEPSDADNRFRMVQFCLEGTDNLYPFKFEIEKKHNGSTHETLLLLDEKYPQHQFTVIIGIDNADVFDKWKNHEELMSNWRFLVVGESDKSENAWYTKEPHIHMKKDPKGRSTKIRQAVKDGNINGLMKMTHPKVAEFIIENNLYSE